MPFLICKAVSACGAKCELNTTDKIFPNFTSATVCHGSFMNINVSFLSWRPYMQVILKSVVYWNFEGNGKIPFPFKWTSPPPLTTPPSPLLSMGHHNNVSINYISLKLQTKLGSIQTCTKQHLYILPWEICSLVLFDFIWYHFIICLISFDFIWFCMISFHWFHLI